MLLVREHHAVRPDLVHASPDPLPADVREWLARAVRAPRDPAWTADGIVSDEWEPLSPVTGRLDAFEWKVPVATNSRAIALGPTGGEMTMALPSADPALPLASAGNAQ